MDASLATAEAFLREFSRGTKRQRQRLLRKAPWDELRSAALHHPDATNRWWLLFYLDHYANDISTATFAEALHDPDAHVRGMALHSIACEPCKDGELCVADVVPSLIDTVLHDPSARLRQTTALELIRFLHRDPRVAPALTQVATGDPDPLVRHCASEALAGRHARPAKSYERSQRRHASSRSTR